MMDDRIDSDIQYYKDLLEEIKMSFVDDAERMFSLYHAAESVYVALLNLKRLSDD